jgi:predicted ArsR family transcriptional regulator
MARTRTLTLTPRNVAALISPIRQEVLSALGLHGPCSVRALAKQLGRKPTALYYHLQILEKAGAIAAESTTGDRSETVWRVLADRVAFARSRRAAAGPPARAIAKAAMRITGRELDRALASTSGEHVVALRGKAWLGKAEVRKVMRHIEAITTVLQRAKPARRGAKIHAVTLILTPVAATAEQP